VMLRQRRKNEALRKVLEIEHALDFNRRQELGDMLTSTGILLNQAVNARQDIQRAAQDAQLQLDDAQERMRKARELVDEIDNAQKHARSKEEELGKVLMDHQKELLELRLREEKRQKVLEKLTREFGIHAETEDESDFDRKLEFPSQELPEIKAYIARMHFRRGVEIVKLANRIEALKMADDEWAFSSMAKGAIFREVVVAKVREIKEQERMHEVIERILRAKQSTSRGIGT